MTSSVASRKNLFWVLTYAVCAFLITWLTGLAVIFSPQATLVNGANVVAHPLAIPGPLVVILLFVGAYGPALAALVVTAIESGRSGVRILLGQFGRWRVGLQWYVLALLLPSLIAFIAVVLVAVFSRHAPEQWFLLPTPLGLVLLALGPWGEELGWRSYAQAKLQERWRWVPASVLVGVLWFGWHQWPLVTPAGPSVVNVRGLVTFLLYIVSAAVLIAWLYNRAGGSLPIAWMAHVGLNLNLVSAQGVPFFLIAILYGVAAAIVIVFSRGRWQDSQVNPHSVRPSSS
jgi:membrane protease YdiL (CAAX protease family)